MGYLDRANLEAIFLDGMAMKERELERQLVGELQHGGGGIIACDPLVDPEAKPFANLHVPPGSYAVELLRAKKANALAVLWLKPRSALRTGLDWRPALHGGQDAATLTGDQFFGYGVDAGVGCFTSTAARDAMIQRLDALGEDANYYDDVLAEDLDGDWCDHLPGGPGTAANILVFSAGYGDGSYPTFIGYEGDLPVVVVTDFLVIEDGDGRDKEDMFLEAYAKSLPREKLDALQAMEMAAMKGDLAKVRELLAQGVEPNEIIPPMASTAILAAIRKGSVPVLALLLGDRSLPAIPEQFHAAKLGTYLDLARGLKKQNSDIIALLERAAAAATPTVPAPVGWWQRLFGRHLA